MRNALLNPVFRRAQFEDEVKGIESGEKDSCQRLPQTPNPFMTTTLMIKSWPRRLSNSIGVTTTTWVSLESHHSEGHSMYGGTNANDKNESELTQRQLEHLGRSAGDPVVVVCQKYLTGHPKDGAAAWMMNRSSSEKVARDYKLNLRHPVSLCWSPHWTLQNLEPHRPQL
ncbi:unnamed protein product [Aphanomyces euteiches]